ncbi:microbial collagenase precursor [Nitzschia inconspicua]|uniref:Microbial collagenase n=1 Tax=Nitzschia inconspicua TaxID=303405 RepID=A0A9K3L2A5_9STRA|nr:microbial collagenase precursor [Nitzschia inconspicua]
MSLLRNVHTMKWFLELSLVLFLPSHVISLPKGFIAQVVTSTPAVSGIFAPNPRKNGKPMLLLIQKEGKVKVLEEPDESPDSEVILDLSGYMCTETERGLHSITIHPDFESNLYVYLYYTKFKEGCLTEDLEDGPWNVLTRFAMDIQTLTLDNDSREEIWRGASTHDAVHNGVDNVPPSVEFKFDESRNYDVGEEVAFDGSGSSDPEGNQLVFKWFFGDGHESSEMNPIHVYEETGTYTVTLFVQDNLNQVQQLSKTVYVGDPPVATILSPAEGDEFYVGQVLTLEGEAFHLNGTSFEDLELIWEDHYHPFLDPVNGNNIKLPLGPHPEDFHAATNSYLEVILYAKDTESGLAGKTSRLVQPMLVSVGIDSFPPGLMVRVDDKPVTAY